MEGTKTSTIDSHFSTPGTKPNTPLTSCPIDINMAVPAQTVYQQFSYVRGLDGMNGIG